MLCGPLLPTRPETVGGEGRGDVRVPSAGRTLAEPGRVGGGSQVSSGGGGSVGRGLRTVGACAPEARAQPAAPHTLTSRTARLWSDGTRVPRSLKDGRPRPDGAREGLHPWLPRTTFGLGAVSAGGLEDQFMKVISHHSARPLGTRAISCRGALTARAAVALPTFPRAPRLRSAGSLLSPSRCFLKPEEDGARGVQGVCRCEPGTVWEAVRAHGAPW